MGRKAKLIVDEVIVAIISRPDDFQIGAYTLDDRKSGMEFWIANGIFSGGVYRPFKMSFGLRQSWRFHRAVASLKVYKTVRALRKRQS